MPKSIDSGLLSGASTGFNQDIVSFLQKPLILANGTMSSSDTSGTNAPMALFSTFFGNDIYRSKVKGWMAIRATVVLKIQFNADRFMQGRYILAFLPFVASQSYRNSAAKQVQMLAGKTQVTQLPHVQFDLNTDTEAILEIPYVSPYTHYHLNDSTGDVGSVTLYPYIPITTGVGGSQNCQYTLWMSLKDIELVTPTLPQGNFDFSDFEFQMGARVKSSVKKKGRNVIEIEQDSVDVGPLSGVLTRVARVADMVAKVPILSAIAAPVSWAADIAASAASVFGWSKPINLEKIGRTQLIDYAYANNCDAVDNSLQLGLFCKNQVEAMPGFAGTDVDEMSIDYIKTIPAYITYGTWTTAQSPGAQLYLDYPGPLMGVLKPTDAATTYSSVTPMAFLAGMFRNYRGSVKLTFKFAKTEFHSGRLVFAYAPKGGELNTAPTLATSNYVHREIIDLRMGNEFSFVVPFASTQPYYQVSTTYGVVVLMVLNELTAPASVNSTIQFVIEASAAPDMEFAIPKPISATPYVPLTIQSGGFDFSDFEFQMDSSNSNSIESVIVGGSSIFDDGLASSRFCVGEKIMSLSSLVKRSFMSTTNSNQGSSTDFFIYPWSISSAAGIGNSASTYGVVYDLNNTDAWSLINSCFAVSRGGVRYKIVNTAYNTQNITANLEQFATVGVAINNTVTASPANNLVLSNRNTNGALGVRQNGVSKQGLEVQIPMYGRFPIRVNQELMITGSNNSSVSTSQSGATPTTVLWVNQQTAGANLMFLRSAADDFQCGYFIGIPPLLGFNTS